MQRFPRRRFLALSIASAGAVFGATACGSDARSEADDDLQYFPQSVASGDPRPHSVVLWTRVEDAARVGETLELELELATDAAFGSRVALGGEQSLKLSADPAFDGCVKARIDELHSEAIYYYRFRYRHANGVATSPIGRTKTAPDEDADTAVKFAVVCCQNYEQGYYHVYRRLLDEELDFVLHLGDYVYETANIGAEATARTQRFGREGDAIVVTPGETLAARSLDNYRELYRTVRSDPDLQAAHERFAMIVMWDDHEFSDDCHAATATYFDGRRDETDLDRRAAADQAFFEYQPIDYDTLPASSWQPELGFPDNLTLYRSFVFGRHLELVLTDLRRYRPDHLIPEQAFPGAIAVLAEDLVDPPADLVLAPYIDVDAGANSDYRTALRDNASALGFEPDAIQGKLSAPWINQQLQTLSDNGVADLPDMLELSASGALGIAYHQLAKSEQYSRIGSRYLLVEAPFHALAHAGFAASDGRSQNLMGSAQREWFLRTLQNSKRTFKVWGSEVCFQPRVIDLSAQTALPPTLQARLQISAEDWDGFPDERAELLRALGALDNVIVLSGDLHAFFAGVPFDADNPELRVVELLTSSVSSTTWTAALQDALKSQPNLPPGAALLVAAVGQLLQDPVTRPNKHLAFGEVGKNGASVVQIDGDAFNARVLMIAPTDVAKASLTGDVAGLFSEERFRVQVGTKVLERQIEGNYTAWNTDSGDWQMS